MTSDEIKKEGVEIPIEDGNKSEEVSADDKVEETAAGEAADEAADKVTSGETEGEEAEETADSENAEAGQGTDAEGSEEEPSDEGDDMQAKYVRLMAEFQNYKKRTAKEKEDIYSFGSEKIMSALAEVLDNFERALEQGSTDEKYAEGMNLIFTQLIGALSKCGLEEINALGEDFDPNFHSAVLMEDSDEYESGKVCTVIQKGYKLNGKVIRPAMVKVAN